MDKLRARLGLNPAGVTGSNPVRPPAAFMWGLRATPVGATSPGTIPEPARQPDYFGNFRTVGWRAGAIVRHGVDAQGGHCAWRQKADPKPVVGRKSTRVYATLEAERQPQQTLDLRHRVASNRNDTTA